MTPNLLRSPFSACGPAGLSILPLVWDNTSCQDFLDSTPHTEKVYQILKSWCSWIYNQKKGKDNVIEEYNRVGFLLSVVKYSLFSLKGRG